MLGIKLSVLGSSRGLIMGLALTINTFAFRSYSVSGWLLESLYLSPLFVTTLAYQLKAFGQFLPNLLLQRDNNTFLRKET